MNPTKMIDPFWYFHQMKTKTTWIHDVINEKQQFDYFKNNFWEDEFIVEVSGMDCDGVQYSGQLMTGPLSYYAYKKRIDYEYEWADGPIYFRPVTPHTASSIVPYSRDLAAEAFENGHPHLLTTTGD